MAFGIRAVDGSAAIPQFSFANDTDSGFYRIGSDNIGLSLGGTKRWDFTTTGSTLTGTLTVSGAASLASGVQVTGSTGFAGGVGLELGYVSAGSYGLLQAFSRTSGLFLDLRLDALSHSLRISGTEKLAISNAGSVIVGSAALATNATDGFLYVPSSAGAPTGTPTTHTGRVPVHIDTTNGRIYSYYGGAWHYATLT